MEALEVYERAAAIADALPTDAAREEFAALLEDLYRAPSLAKHCDGVRRFLREAGYVRTP